MMATKMAMKKATKMTTMMTMAIQLETESLRMELLSVQSYFWFKNSLEGDNKDDDNNGAANDDGNEDDNEDDDDGNDDDEDDNEDDDDGNTTGDGVVEDGTPLHAILFLVYKQPSRCQQ